MQIRPGQLPLRPEALGAASVGKGKNVYWSTRYGHIEVVEQIFRAGAKAPEIRPFTHSAAVVCRGCSESLQRALVDFGARRNPALARRRRIGNVSNRGTGCVHRARPGLWRASPHVRAGLPDGLNGWSRNARPSGIGPIGFTIEVLTSIPRSEWGVDVRVVRRYHARPALRGCRGPRLARGRVLARVSDRSAYRR